MKAGMRTGAGVLVVLAVAAGVTVWLRRPEPPAVTTVAVDRGAVIASVANTRAGTVKPCRRAHLAPNAGGQVTVLNVKEGTRVETGAVLLEIWHGDLDAQLTQARVEHQAARARAAEACQRAEVARREAARLATLAPRGFVSADLLDRTRTEAGAGAAACTAAGKTADAAQARIAVTEAAIARTVLRAPFGGVVAEVNAELGEFITPSPTGIPTLPAVDLIDDSCLYVSVPVDEVDASAVALGMPVRITLDAFSGQEFSGRVRRIAPYVLELEKQARTVEVEVAFDPLPDNRALLVGYSADAQVVTARADDALRVPPDAVTDDGRVFAVDADGRVRARTVETGLRNWDHVQLLGGPPAGTVLVRSPAALGLQDGQRVRAGPLPQPPRTQPFPTSTPAAPPS